MSIGSLPPLRIALADPSGNIPTNVDSLSLDELAALLSVTGAFTRFLEMRAILQGVNSGVDGAGNPIEGLARGQNGNGSTAKMFSPLAGSAQALMVQLDGRRCVQLNANAAQNVCWAFRPTSGGAEWMCDVNGDAVAAAGAINYPSTSSTIVTAGLQEPAFGWCTTIMAWCRKVNAVDGSDGRVCVGFADNRTTSQSRTVSRVGLIGDGLGGYLYGSVNCPDGGVAGPNLATDHDAELFQPADLVAPGTNWWHSTIRLVPATPTQSARIGVYHNGVLVHTFADQHSFPRGHQGTSDANAQVEASLLNFGSDVGVPAGGIPGPGLFQIEVFLDDNYTL